MNEPERQQRLWDITNYALKKFRDAGFEIGETESPIIPLYVRDAEKTFIVTKMAFDEGIFINPVIPPACATARHAGTRSIDGYSHQRAGRLCC